MGIVCRKNEDNGIVTVSRDYFSLCRGIIFVVFIYDNPKDYKHPVKKGKETMSYIPVELQETLKRGECVLFVGAGLSEDLPQWKELAAPLAKELGITEEDPRLVAEYYENKYGRKELENNIISQLKKDVPLTHAHNLLARLPVKAIITTNYDHLLEKALSPKNVYKIVHGEKAPSIQSNQLPLVKMHGDLDDPSTMVITKPDYEEYAENHRSLITYLLGFLITSNLLFVGFSLKDPNFDNIYTQMRTLFKDTHRKSYAVFKDISEHERARLKRMGIEVIPIDTYDEIPLIFEEFISLCSDLKGKPELTPQQVESVQNTFREIVERQNTWLDPRGIFQFERMLTKREVELEQIYVIPRFVKQIIRRKKREKNDMDESKKENSLKDGDTETRGEEKQEEDYLFEKQVELSIKDALSDVSNKHAVILGDPGSGKSCLLQYIALKASANPCEVGVDRVLPVLIPLREYSKYGQKEMFKEFIFHYIDKQICSLPENVLEYFLDKNLFFFLLDGLDEVVRESERIEVSRQIERFMAQYPGTRMILTSRPAGYRPAALIGTVPHFTLADFNEDEIEEFLVKWFMFLDKIEEEMFEEDKTVEKAHKLAGIIMGREKILRLAKNPLLLTILVLIHRVGGKLPERRVEFYDLAVRTVTGSWETWKNLQVDKKIPGQGTVLAILEKVGFNLHKEKQENVVEIKELTTWLKEAMEEEVGQSSREEVDDFIWMLKERMGLLVEKGVGLYGFVHLTFQEYFAAQYIATERDVELVKDLIKKYVHSSHWREAFLLAAAIASPERADVILDSALGAENPFEKYIHANVMAAGLMLADLPRVKSSKRKDVIEKLISFTDPGNIDLLRVDALEVLAEIGRTSPIEDSSWALRLLHDKDRVVRRQAVTYFTTVGAADLKIQKRIFALLRDKDWDVRRQAVTYFTTVGAADLKIQKRIFALLRDKDWDVRRQAVTYFTTVGAADLKIQKRFFALLHDKDRDVRRQAVTYFTTVGAADLKIQERIFALLHDEDSDVCTQAVRFLSRYAREESSKRAPNLFKSSPLPTRRAVYTLMKALLQTQENPPITSSKGINTS